MDNMTVKEALEQLRYEIEEEGHCSYIEAEMKVAFECMEKQIPQKPIGKHTSYKCPVCDRRVRSGKGSSSRGVDYFCQRCGQAIDWSDTE